MNLRLRRPKIRYIGNTHSSKYWRTTHTYIYSTTTHSYIDVCFHEFERVQVFPGQMDVFQGQFHGVKEVFKDPERIPGISKSVFCGFWVNNTVRVRHPTYLHSSVFEPVGQKNTACFTSEKRRFTKWLFGFVVFLSAHTSEESEVCWVWTDSLPNKWGSRNWRWTCFLWR